MLKHRLHKNFLFIILTGFAFFSAEFFIKNYMIVSSSKGEMRLTEWLSLTFVPNKDMAFSIPINQIVLYGIASIVLLGLIQYFTVSCRDGLYGNVWALNFIIWGAFSNLYDRITRGFVVDYIDIGSWPVFNLADVAIFLGFVALIVMIARQERRNVYELSEA